MLVPIPSGFFIMYMEDNKGRLAKIAKFGALHNQAKLNLVLDEGFEPSTYRLQGGCSTN